MPQVSCPQFLSLAHNLPAVFVACSWFLSLRWSETTEAICLPVLHLSRFLSLRAVQNARCGNLLVSDRHTMFAMTTLNLPQVSCLRFLSLRWNVVTEAISLQAALVFGLLRYARNDKSQDGRESQGLLR